MGLVQRKQRSAVMVEVLPSFSTFTMSLSARVFTTLPSYPPAAPETDSFRTALAVAAAIGHIECGEYAEALDVLRKIQQLPSPNGAALRLTVEDHQHRGVPSLVRAAELYGAAASQKHDPSMASPATRRP